MTEIPISSGSGNAFDDLGFPEADQELAKAVLSHRIQEIVEARGLTQSEAATRLGISQPDVSRVVRGSLEGFSLERLSRFLNDLGQDVEIRVTPAEAGASRGRLWVAASPR